MQVSIERSAIVVNNFDQAVICQTASTVKNYQTAVIKPPKFVEYNLTYLFF